MLRLYKFPRGPRPVLPDYATTLQPISQFFGSGGSGLCLMPSVIGLLRCAQNLIPLRQRKPPKAMLAFTVDRYQAFQRQQLHPIIEKGLFHVPSCTVHICLWHLLYTQNLVVGGLVVKSCR